MDRKVRLKLDELIQMDGGKNWWMPDLFDLHVKNNLPEELVIVTGPPPESENFNCFIYTLGLSENKEICRDSEGFIFSNLFVKLIDEGLLSEISKPQKGDYVAYFECEKERMINHVGLVEDKDSVLSKWSWGPLLRHGLKDVPNMYGDCIKYYKSIPKERAEEFYWKYKAFNTK